MNNLHVVRDRIPAILQAIDEIAFHTSVLALNAAVTAAGESPAPETAEAQSERQTLELIEESIQNAHAAGSEEMRDAAMALVRRRAASDGKR